MHQGQGFRLSRPLVSGSPGLAKRLHPVALDVQHALLDVVPGPRCPVQQWRRDVLLHRPARAGDAQPVVLGQAQRSQGAVDLDEGLGERLAGQPGRIRAIDHRHRTVRMVEQHGGDVLAADRRVDALGARCQPRHVAEQAARDIEDVDAKILDDEPLAGGEVRLAAEHVIAGTERKPAPEWLADAPDAIVSRTARIGVCQRKFSCTMSGMRACPAAATMARASAIEVANGFLQITGRACRAASSTSARWLGGVVAMSTKSSACSRTAALRPGIDRRYGTARRPEPAARDLDRTAPRSRHRRCPPRRAAG